MTVLQAHQQRVLDEKRELDEKRAKLRAFFSTAVYQGLSAIEKALLQRQANVMADYSGILSQRIAAFKDEPGRAPKWPLPAPSHRGDNP